MTNDATPGGQAGNCWSCTSSCTASTRSSAVENSTSPWSRGVSGPTPATQRISCCAPRRASPTGRWSGSCASVTWSTTRSSTNTACRLPPATEPEPTSGRWWRASSRTRSEVAVARSAAARVRGRSRLAAAAAHGGYLCRAVLMLESLHRYRGLDVTHARQGKDTIVDNLRNVLERAEQSDRQDVEPPEHQDDALDLGHGGNLLTQRPELPVLCVDSNQRQPGRACKREVRDGGETDRPALFQALDAAADRAFGHAELGSDPAVAHPRIHCQKLDNPPIEPVEAGGRSLHVIGARSKSYLITCAAIPAASVPMPRIFARSRSRNASSSSRSCSATRISTACAPVTRCAANTCGSAASSCATSGAGRPCTWTPIASSTLQPRAAKSLTATTRMAFMFCRRRMRAPTVAGEMRRLRAMR